MKGETEGLPATKREHLRQLIAAKNRWNRLLSPSEKRLGFLGWHQRGYLPHCDYPGLVQLVTFRLADSMPSTRKGEWEHLLSIENVRAKREKLEEYLDLGHGTCWLRNPQIAALCEEALFYFNDERYDLRAWCVMPNHVHVLLEVWLVPLWKIVQSWKRFVATNAQPILLERRPPARRI